MNSWQLKPVLSVSGIVHLPDLPEKIQPHFAYSVWCQKDHAFGSHPFRTVERKPSRTLSVPTPSAVGQKEMENAVHYESLLSSIQRPKSDKVFFKYNYIKQKKEKKSKLCLPILQFSTCGDQKENPFPSSLKLRVETCKR